MPKVNIEDAFYKELALRLNMGEDDCREMYENLHPEVRRELNNYICRVKQMELEEELRDLEIFENNKSNILITTMQAQVA